MLTVIARTLMTALSRPDEKETVIQVVTNTLGAGNRARSRRFLVSEDLSSDRADPATRQIRVE